MAATNSTSNYELPLFIGTDKPSWLGDWNGAMNKIDAAIGTVAGEATMAANEAASASTAAAAAQAAVTALQTTVQNLNTDLQQVQTNVLSQGENIQNLQERVSSLEEGGDVVPGSFNVRRIYNANLNSTTILGYLTFAILKADGGKTIIPTGFSQFKVTAQASFAINTGGSLYCIGRIPGNPLNLSPVTYGNNQALPLYRGARSNQILSSVSTSTYNYAQVAYCFFYDSASNNTAICMVWGSETIPANFYFGASIATPGTDTYGDDLSSPFA